MKPETYRERALRVVGRLSELEVAARLLAAETAAGGVPIKRRMLAEAALDFAAAVRTMQRRDRP